MTAAVPLLFYAPLKAPDHPTLSGDRTVARLLLRALSSAGFRPELASSLRTFEPEGCAARQDGLREASGREAERIERAVRALAPAERPRLVFTYHGYYKAPDWLGPLLADRLGLPYAVAEASRAEKRASGPFSLAHAGAERALARADAIFVTTGRDREALARVEALRPRLVDLPPFADEAEWDAGPASRRLDRADGPLRLLAVAMMRPGDKLASFRELAAALRLLPERIGGRPWRLDVVGDGPARGAVEEALAPLDRRAILHGAVAEKSRLAAFYGSADLLVWPAVNEAFGMVLLEAQMLGCPVLAGRQGGVADAMRPGETGLLAPPGDPAAFAALLADLAGSPSRLAAMSAAARRFVREERSLPAAAAILGGTLHGLLRTRRAA